MKLKPIEKPSEIAERFKKAWNSYDAEGIARLFFENADFVNVTGKWWDNKEDILKAHEFGFRVIFKNSHLEILNVKEKMLSEDIAIVHTRIRLTGQTEKDVEKADIRETMFLFVLRKIDGQWLCESAQNTDIVFGMQTNIRNEKGELKSVSYKKVNEKITRDLNED
ncbi:MAG TPA: SgcJ/EcaC family oxidoreductase [Dysgonamonadaceae bacterium]|nr:SgcJ/EcaC family oxidoreductase [Dysgonamonadaceae bacterium]